MESCATVLLDLAAVGSQTATNNTCNASRLPNACARRFSVFFVHLFWSSLIKVKFSALELVLAGTRQRHTESNTERTSLGAIAGGNLCTNFTSCCGGIPIA